MSLVEAQAITVEGWACPIRAFYRSKSNVLNVNTNQVIDDAGADYKIRTYYPLIANHSVFNKMLEGLYVEFYPNGEPPCVPMFEDRSCQRPTKPLVSPLGAMAIRI
jgi:hypothetical protein